METVDDDGTAHAVSPTCTHRGCRAPFDDAQGSWACACHGSRFGLGFRAARSGHAAGEREEHDE